MIAYDRHMFGDRFSIPQSFQIFPNLPSISHIFDIVSCFPSASDSLQDSIHLNEAGYRLLWDHPPLQAAMQCLLGQSVSGAEPRRLQAASLASLVLLRMQ